MDCARRIGEINGESSREIVAERRTPFRQRNLSEGYIIIIIISVVIPYIYETASADLG